MPVIPVLKKKWVLVGPKQAQSHTSLNLKKKNAIRIKGDVSLKELRIPQRSRSDNTVTLQIKRKIVGARGGKKKIRNNNFKQQ